MKAGEFAAGASGFARAWLRDKTSGRIGRSSC